MTAEQPCYCGSTNSFVTCCQPIINGSKPAGTAEQLMRSRFSAFCTANVDYLIASHHPSKRKPDDRKELADTIEHCQWLALSILDAQQGQAGDERGEVEFVALYKQRGELSRLQERSRFVQNGDQWFYLDGDISDSPAAIKIGRNSPCPCGSGKKFKKCCSD